MQDQCRYSLAYCYLAAKQPQRALAVIDGHESLIAQDKTKVLLAKAYLLTKESNKAIEVLERQDSSEVFPIDGSSEESSLAPSSLSSISLEELQSQNMPRRRSYYIYKLEQPTHL